MGNTTGTSFLQRETDLDHLRKEKGEHSLPTIYEHNRAILEGGAYRPSVLERLIYCPSRRENTIPLPIILRKAEHSLAILEGGA